MEARRIGCSNVESMRGRARAPVLSYRGQMNRSTTTFLRHALLTAVAAVILFSAAACGGSSGNPNTPTDVTSTPIASASPRPVATSSPAGSPAVPPLVAASPTGVSGSTPAPRPTQPAPSTPTQLPAPSSVSLTIVASGLRFVPNSLTAPAGALVNVTLDNRDDGLPHNITFYDPAGTRVAET